MNRINNIKKKRFFTLIELITVIVVLGILAAIVIPNINSFKEESIEVAIKSDTRNIQTAVDMYGLDFNGATPTKEKATLGNPQIIEVYGLQPDYIRKAPTEKGAKFWLDANNTVWASMVDAPARVKGIDSGLEKVTISWDTVDGATLYKVYSTSDSAVVGKVNTKGMQFKQDVEVSLGVEQSVILPKLTKGTYLVTALDKFSFESAPTKVDTSYSGYGTGPSKDYQLKNPTTPVIEVAKPIKTEVPVGWIGIYTVEDLNNIRANPTGNFILMNNLDLNVSPHNEGLGWKSIGHNAYSPFNGIFDGNGLTISNLYMDRSDLTYYGLFGYVKSGKIQNLNLSNVDIKGPRMVGSLAGYTEQTTIENVSSSGVIQGYNTNVGGLIGSMYSSTIKNSFSTTNIGTYSTVSDQSSHYYGGLVGYAYTSSKIYNSYATGNVSAYNVVGGLVGYLQMNSTVNNSYSTGKVTSTLKTGGLIGDNESSYVYNSFWDKETSNLTTSYGGTGKSTVELMQKSTFTSWDFDTLWEIDEGNSRPKLKR